MNTKFLIFAGLLLAIIGCKSDPTVAVKKAQSAFQATPSKDNFDAYTIAIKEFVKDNGTDHGTCFNLLNDAAVSAYKMKFSQLALQFAGDAVAIHGQGQNLSGPMTTLALISRDLKYKEMSTMRFEQPDFDRLSSLLKNNINWLDSAMVSMKTRFVIDSTNKIDREMAMKYAYTADAAATVRNDPERSPSLLLSAAEAAIAGENYLKAVSTYDWLLEKWPDSKKAPQAAFMRAFTIENNINDQPGAKKAYEDFIKKYPNDEFADDAQAALKNLGKSPEELVKEFEKMNKK